MPFVESIVMKKGRRRKICLDVEAENAMVRMKKKKTLFEK